VLTCKSSQEAATYKSGSGLSGTKIATITSATFSNCTGPAGLALTVTGSALGTCPWYRNAVSYKAKSGVAQFVIHCVHVVVSGPGCVAVIDGTGGSVFNGTFDIEYTESLATLKLLPTGGNLHFWNVSGCLGLIANGDVVTFGASYKFSPRQTITSP